MKIYDFTHAPNPRKVRVYLAEKGIQVPLQKVDLMAGEQRSPEFLKINPLGGVPVLELDDGTIIPESLAIIEYFEELYPNPPLMGTDPVSRARVRAYERRCEQGVLAQAATMFQHTNPFFAGRVDQTPKVAEIAQKNLTARLAWLNDELKDREWVAGDKISIADITLLIAVDFSRASQYTLDPAWTNLIRWHNAMKARPSAKA
ncbi:MAG: glutathione S-transferase family protein [Deltaproteobacteria bacterium]|nr:glutathione S-transferase family protein [Deltaproteobacteria bacterium]